MDASQAESMSAGRRGWRQREKRTVSSISSAKQPRFAEDEQETDDKEWIETLSGLPIFFCIYPGWVASATNPGLNDFNSFGILRASSAQLADKAATWEWTKS